MCECGCVSNDQKYRLPAKGRSFYLVTLVGGCTECDYPPGVAIELITQSHALFKEYKRGEFVDGDLPLTDWSDGKGCMIVTGMLSHEFTAKLTPSLVGLDSNELGENGVLDQAGAEVTLEEMFSEATVRPFIQPNRASVS